MEEKIITLYKKDFCETDWSRLCKKFEVKNCLHITCTIALPCNELNADIKDKMAEKGCFIFNNLIEIIEILEKQTQLYYEKWNNTSIYDSESDYLEGYKSGLWWALNRLQKLKDEKDMVAFYNKYLEVIDFIDDKHTSSYRNQNDISNRNYCSGEESGLHYSIILLKKYL